MYFLQNHPAFSLVWFLGVLTAACLITKETAAFSPKAIEVVRISSSVLKQRRHIILASSSWDNKQQQPFGSESDDQASSASSVGDYVQGVHGGKYQFEDFGGATFEGRQFAESLYASSDPYEDVISPSDDVNNEESIPAWAERMGTCAKLGLVQPLQRFPILTISPSQQSQQKPVTITITNDERSWEHYYSKIVQVSSDGKVLDDTAVWCHLQQKQQEQLSPTETYTPVHVSPATGHLAPRGGSSNLCDPSKPYSDSAHIQIQTSPGEGTDAERTTSRNEDNHHLLVVGTEAESWCFWIQIN